jgi:hypothetical protein
MLQEVIEDDDLLQVSSAMRLVNISGTIRDGKEVKVSKQLYYQTSLNERVHSSATTTLVQKLKINEYRRNGKRYRGGKDV